jgi:simple sugar transport system permease protein
MSANDRRVRAIVVTFAATITLVNLAIWIAGAAPVHVWQLVIAGTLGSGYGLAQMLAKATPLIFTGVSVAYALRAGLFNIGAEGQLAAGILVAAVLGAHVPGFVPWWIGAPLVTLGAGLAGAALGGTAGYLRGRFGVHEVISTLMLNGLVAVLVTYLYGGPLRVGEQVYTRAVTAGARIPTFDAWIPALRGSALNVALLVALAIPFLADAELHRTAAGLRVRALGSNAAAARALGVPLTATTTRAMAVAGFFAGCGGLHYVLGAKGYAEDGLGIGVGFTGLAVAMLAQGRAWGIVVAAVLFGLLQQGGLVVNAIVPSDMLAVAQGIVLIAAAALGAHLHATREART